jgi:glycosyltransferase involved in cell wall biosynthesis
MNISVIIPSYRPQDYLWECLDSLAAQTFPMSEFEVIIVLNGCREPYFSEIRKYMDKHADMNIRLIQADMGGVSVARNIGLDNANGRYIAFIDDDDKVSSSYLQEMYEKADDQTIVLSDTYNFFEGKPEELIPARLTELHRQLSPKGRTNVVESRRFFFSACMKLIPAAAINDRRFNPSFKVGEDGIFMFLISDRIRYTDFTSEKAIYFRCVRHNSAMGKINSAGRWKVLINDLKMIAEYSKIYLLGLRRYSLFFYLTRIRGSIHL